MTTGIQGQPTPISQYLEKLSSSTNAQFLEDHTAPFFLIEPFTAMEDTGFQTITGVKGTANEDCAVQVAKRDGANAFSHMITIGRAGNNDVVIRYRGISKFHAYVPVGKDQIELVDVGSTNGTFVDGVQLESQAAVALESGCRIRFSDLNLTYYTAEDFLSYLEPRL